MPKYHTWTGKVQPFTVSDEDIHAEIAEGQVIRWTPEQITAAEKQGYFADLTRRANAKRYGSLLDETEELEME